MAGQTKEDRPYENWGAVMEALLSGAPDEQQLAFAKLNRLISSFLADLRAWDYRDDWEDLRQLVLMKVVKSVSQGRLQETKAFVSYVRTITRNEFFDFLKERSSDETGALPESDGVTTQDEAALLSVRSAFQRLPEDQRKAVRAVYIEERTYEEAAAKTAIPLGSLKRYLRLALLRLRKQLSEGE